MATAVNSPAKPSTEQSPTPPPPTEPSTPVASKPPEQLTPPPPSEPELIHIPSHSSWFSWDDIHECEIRWLPEFFENRSPSKNPNTYKYLRNSIIKHFRNNYNSNTKITYTDVRRTLVGDVGSIRRVFEFLETWGLINHFPSSSSSSSAAQQKPFKSDEKDKDSNSSSSKPAAASDALDSSKKDTNAKRVCSGCKSLCSIACFTSDKYDMTLCARCYVRANYPLGVSSSEFRRVEISEETRPDWTEKDTLHLLEGIMHFGDDWKKVSHHVGGRSEKECVAQFLKLPFGEEFLGHPMAGDAESDSKQLNDEGASECPSKKMRLTPLADASNPIMAQAAFLSALAGVEVAEVAAQAAVSALSEVDCRAGKGSLVPLSRPTIKQEADGSSDGNAISKLSQEAFVDVNSQLEKEQRDVEGAVSEIIDVQMEGIQDRIVRFEELDLQMEKEWQQFEQMRNSLFVDQLALLFHKNTVPKTENSREQ